MSKAHDQLDHSQPDEQFSESEITHSVDHAETACNYINNVFTEAGPHKRSFLQDISADKIIDIMKSLEGIVRTGSPNPVEFDGYDVRTPFLQPPEHDEKEPLLRYAWDVSRECLADEKLSEKEALEQVATLMGYMTVAAHPYHDGNGRLSRLMYMLFSSEFDTNLTNTESIIGRNGRKVLDFVSVCQSQWVVADQLAEKVISDERATDLEKATFITYLVVGDGLRGKANRAERYSRHGEMFDERYPEYYRKYRKLYLEEFVNKPEHSDEIHQNWLNAKSIYNWSWIECFKENPKVELNVDDTYDLARQTRKIVPPQSMDFRQFVVLSVRYWSSGLDRVQLSLDERQALQERYGELGRLHRWSE